MNYPGVNSGVSNKPPYPQSLSPDGGKGSRVIPAVSCPLRGKDVRRTARGLPFAEGNHVNPGVELRGILSIKLICHFYFLYPFAPLRERGMQGGECMSNIANPYVYE